MIEDALIDELLNRIEQVEYASLVWGFVDSGMRREEVVALAEALIAEKGVELEAEELVEALIERRVLFENLTQGDIYRSRFSETARLLARLRQLFPRKRWEGAPRLVADYRIDRRPRRYPKRTINASTAVEQFSTPPLTALQRGLWAALVNRDGSEMLFARFQVSAMQELLSKKGQPGIIVTAGTGSGKTFCFYLPALLELGSLVKAREFWTKAVAIYPRTELLKDQFSEAFRLTRRTDDVLRKAGKRLVRLGALFGATPNRASKEDLERKWLRRPGGFCCPHLLCPRCGGELVWRDEDLEARRERLVCGDQSCQFGVGQEQIVLTRESMVREPPDLLFTTTEMLNRRLSDVSWRTILGIGMPKDWQPRMILLDEVHTYTGINGAQAANVLRRWRHAMGASVRWVGLSATLLEAERFFAELVGLSSSRVSEIAPTDEELEEEGSEYQILLRGDPASQASLLSTSIQATFLIARLLDPRARGRSENRAGSRVFVFTDDLDVANRLFDNVRDAEAYDAFGRPDVGREPLAALRRRLGTDASERRRRDSDGQQWQVCEEIGRGLSDRLIVGRTTSQDVGVAEESDVVVATAALEVGYNDPRVGAVVQHKAPRHLAAYVQRKGRGGRDRRMRPWMITVLSDYGRDRLAFQTYERLFEPQIPRQSLPIRNLYLLRMQAVYALLDWLSTKFPSGQRVWLWNLLGEPLEKPGQGTNGYRKDLLARVANVLKDLLRLEADRLGELRLHLRQALLIDDETVEAVLWESPRSLMLEVIPTLVRRVWTDWRLAFPDDQRQHDYFERWHPLPDFVPSNLFSDLGLPDVRVHFPVGRRDGEESEESMPLMQALNHLVPGRVTRRFAYQRGGLNHWVPLSWQQPETEIDIANISHIREHVGDFGANGIPVFRPWAIRLRDVRADEVLPTSNARWEWASDLCPLGEELVLPGPNRSVWRSLECNVTCYQNALRTAVSVRRYANEGEARLLRRTGNEVNEHRVSFRVTANGKPAAIGFEHEVDALRIRYSIPSSLELIELANEILPIDVSCASRTAYFRDRVQSDPELKQAANPFLLEWLRQIYLTALVEHAVDHSCSLEHAQGRLQGLDLMDACRRVMRGVFKVQTPVDEGEDEAEDEGERTQRLAVRLGELIDNQNVRDRLATLASEFRTPTGPEWGRWLRERVHETLSQAWLEACTYCAPRHAALEGLLVDPAEIGADGPAEIWVTESTPGGVGVVQALAQVYAEEPRRLFVATEAALAPSEDEVTSIVLRRFVHLVCVDPEVADTVSLLQETTTHAEREPARKRLFELLYARGLSVGRSFSIALSTRLLRPGLNRDAFELLERLYAWWDELQSVLGLMVELRLFAYLAARHDVFGPEIRRLVGGGQRDVSEIAQALTSVLWARPEELRQFTLRSYNPFRGGRGTDPGLVRALLLNENLPVVQLGEADWSAQLSARLAEFGICRLEATYEQSAELRKALTVLPLLPISAGYLQLFATIDRFERNENSISVLLTLREEL